MADGSGGDPKDLDVRVTRLEQRVDELSGAVGAGPPGATACWYQHLFVHHIYHLACWGVPHPIGGPTPAAVHACWASGVPTAVPALECWYRPSPVGGGRHVACWFHQPHVACWARHACWSRPWVGATGDEEGDEAESPQACWSSASAHVACWFAPPGGAATAPGAAVECWFGAAGSPQPGPPVACWFRAAGSAQPEAVECWYRSPDASAPEPGATAESGAPDATDAGSATASEAARPAKKSAKRSRAAGRDPGARPG